MWMKIGIVPIATRVNHLGIAQKIFMFLNDVAII